MDQVLGVADGHVGFGDAGQDTLRQVTRRGQALTLVKSLGSLIEGHQIGEGATDIHRKKCHVASPPVWECFR